MGKNKYFNPDGSYTYGKGKPISNKINIDPSKIQVREVSNNPSPWIKSPSQVSGGSYPQGFMNDGVGLKAPVETNFTMPNENAGLPQRYVAQPDKVMDASKPFRASFPKSPINGQMVGNKFELGSPNVSLPQALTALLVAEGAKKALTIEDANAGDQANFENSRLQNKPLNYEVNPALEISNMNFNDPLLAAAMSGGVPVSKKAVAATQPAKKSTVNMVDENGNPIGDEDVVLDGTEFNEEKNLAAIPLGPEPTTSVTPGMVNGRTENSPVIPGQAQKSINVGNGNSLDSMILGGINDKEKMQADRDLELMRLLGMRDSMESSLAGKSNFDRMDLSPLMAFVDSMYGSRTQAGYRKPATAIDDINVLNSMNKQIADEKKAKNAELMNMYKLIKDTDKDQQMLELRAKLAERDPLAGKLAYLAASQEYKQNQPRNMQENSVQKITDTDNSIGLITNLIGETQTNKELFGPIKGLSKINPYDDRVQQLESKISVVRQIVGKAMEGGVLKREDEKKYEKMLASMTNTPETAEAKMREILKDLQLGRSNYINNLRRARYDTSGFETSPQPQSSTDGGANQSLIEAANAEKARRSQGKKQ